MTSATVFEVCALTTFSRALGLGKVATERGFRALFGVSTDTWATVWDLLKPRIPHSGRPVHLLWAFLFLKVYATEHVKALIAGVDEKTFRKWSLQFISLIAGLRVITWESRQNSMKFGSRMASVDGTYFRMYEPTPFDPKWYSHKFKGPGLRYEVCVSVETGKIMWTHGTFPCGSLSDVSIFKLALKDALDSAEDIVADGGYRDNKCRTPTEMNSYRAFDAVVRARHETVNRRFKNFFVFPHRFRHQLPLHSRCFHAVAKVVEIMIERGEPLFQISS